MIPDFSKTEREAVICLVIEMINADNIVQFEELVASNHINQLLGITEDEFALAMRLNPRHACEVVRKMDDDSKRYVASLLSSVMDADEDVADEECRLLNRIAELTGIDSLFP